jgi:nucleoside-diphosphate-sugar epimerase
MIFVTGGTGLVGAHLLYELTKANKHVKALKRETSNLQQVLKTFSYYTSNPEKLFEKIEWVNGNILDYFSLENLLEGVTEIYHCAAIVSFQPTERRKIIANNVDGTSNLVNAALVNGVKKICHVSSVAALGKLENGMMTTEETNWIPSKKVSGYSESKFFSETEIWRGIEEGLNAVIVNPSIILGPGNWDNGSSKIFKTIWDGMKFYTRGVTGYVDVKDVVKAMISLMDGSNFDAVKNQRFLLNAENLSYQEVFTRIADALGKPQPNYYASEFLVNLTWRAAKLFSVITHKPVAITRETAAASQKVARFDGSKITRTIPFHYLSISESIKQTAKFYKMDVSK